LFDAILTDDDAFRATVVVNELLAHGFRGSLTERIVEILGYW
jgi:hypothetical protein